MYSLSSDRAYSSISECNALVKAYMECVRYMIGQSIAEDEFDLSDQLVKDHVSLPRCYTIFST